VGTLCWVETYWREEGALPSFSLKMLLVTWTGEQRECHLTELAEDWHHHQHSWMLSSQGWEDKALAAPIVEEGQRRRRATVEEWGCCWMSTQDLGGCFCLSHPRDSSVTGTQPCQGSTAGWLAMHSPCMNQATATACF